MLELIETLLRLLDSPCDKSRNKEPAKDEEKPVKMNIATGAPPECTLAHDTDDKARHEKEDDHLTNAKEKAAKYVVNLNVDEGRLSQSFFDYRDQSDDVSAFYAAVLFALIRAIGKEAGMEGESLERFVLDFGVFISDKFVDSISEFTLLKIKQWIKEMEKE